jgi:hypothetical protein
MCSILILPFISKILAISGLSLDIYGVFRLFKLDPEPIENFNENKFEASLSDYSRSEKTYMIAMDLNNKLNNSRQEWRQLKRNGIKYKNIILIGFVFQLISISLTFFY